MLEVSIPIAHELLAQCIKQGQALVQRASLVGDFSDYESWKSARKQWIEPTVQALEHMYGGAREAREFAEAATCTENVKRWQEQYAADLQCVEQAIDLLNVLQGELAFGDGSARTAAEAPITAASPNAGELNAGEHGLAGENEHGNVNAGDPPGSAGHVSLVDEIIETQPSAQQEPGAELLTRAPPLGAELTQQNEDTAPAERPAAHAPAPARAGGEVLLAHGRDERWKQAVEHLLDQAGEHEIRIVNRRSQERARFAEELAEGGPGSRYAVVLLTADDIGGPRLESDAEPYFSTRAHQEVIFEMGFLVAALTPGRVCVLYEDGVELPCDLEGISHVRLDLAGTWQPKLLLHLRRAGFDYDLNKLVAA